MDGKGSDDPFLLGVSRPYFSGVNLLLNFQGWLVPPPSRKGGRNGRTDVAGVHPTDQPVPGSLRLATRRSSRFGFGGLFGSIGGGGWKVEGWFLGREMGWVVFMVGLVVYIYIYIYIYILFFLK